MPPPSSTASSRSSSSKRKPARSSSAVFGEAFAEVLEPTGAPHPVVTSERFAEFRDRAASFVAAAVDSGEPHDLERACRLAAIEHEFLEEVDRRRETVIADGAGDDAGPSDVCSISAEQLTAYLRARYPGSPESAGRGLGGRPRRPFEGDDPRLALGHGRAARRGDPAQGPPGRAPPDPRRRRVLRDPRRVRLRRGTRAAAVLLDEGEHSLGTGTIPGHGTRARAQGGRVLPRDRRADRASRGPRPAHRREPGAPARAPTRAARRDEPRRRRWRP